MLKKAHLSLICWAFIAQGIIGHAFAVPVDLTYDLPPATVKLQGDQSGDVLTLDANHSAVLLNGISHSIPGPQPFSFLHQVTIIAPISIHTPFGTINIPAVTANPTITFDPNMSISVSQSPMQFNLGGTMDFNAGSADLTVTLPSAAETAMTLSGSAVPFFSSNSSLVTPIVDFLTAISPIVTFNATATLQTLSIGTVTLDTTQSGPDLLFDANVEDGNFGLMINYDAGVDFGSESGIVNQVLGSTFQPLINNLVGSQFENYFLGSFSGIFDAFYSNLLTNELSGAGLGKANINCQTSHFVGKSFNQDCTFSASMHLAFTQSNAADTVPEPSTVSLFALGLIGIGFGSKRGQARMRNQ